MFFYGKNAAGQSTGSQTLYIPYLAVAIVVLVLAGVFYFAHMPDINVEDDYHLDDPTDTTHSHSLLSHPHFIMAVAAQFFYVAAQSGIFSFFINYMTSQLPAIPASWNTGMWQSWFETNKAGVLALSNRGASNLASVGFVFFLVGRFTGAGLLRRFAAHRILGLYAAANVVLTLLVFARLGWFSAGCVFLSYFFMSIMFPTIFALGIHGLGVRAKQASAFIVMAIMGGAVLPKLMGYVGDQYGIARGFIVPTACFAVVALYAFAWPRLAGSEGLRGVAASGGH